MRISIFGLGYVGAVTAACLARQGHQIVGVDVHPQKVEAFNEGRAPIVEPGLEDLLRTAKEKGLLRATTNSAEAIGATDLSIICVGTPSMHSGSLDLTFVRQVTRQISECLAPRPKRHLLVYRSTMVPGSTNSLVQEFLRDLVLKGSLEVFFFPEFLREGTAVADFENPSLAVFGVRQGEAPPTDVLELIKSGGIETAVVDWNTAEMIKYACNAFHAAKIAFANEIGRFGKEIGIDAQAVMALLCRDTRLNISPYYLRPGNPFGGSCLPKDVRALCNQGRQYGLNLPLLESLLPSNEHHLHTLLSLIQRGNHPEIVLLGLSFKQDTDDLRESSMVEVAQNLLGRGHKVRIYDPQINLARLVGRNKTMIETKMPHLASLLQNDLAEAIGTQGLIVVSQKCVSIGDLAKCVRPEHRILDVNGWPELKSLPCPYEGFCW